MRFVILRKADSGTEAGLDRGGVPPTAAVLPYQALQPSECAMRLAFSEEGVEQSRGPFAHTEDLVAGFCIIEADSMQAAVDHVRAWSRGDDTDAMFEIRESGCPGGLPGIQPSGEHGSNPRFMVLLKSDEHLEADAPTDAKRLEAMARRNDESVAAGVLLAGEGLKSTAKGARVKFSRGKSSVIDGPFAEAKELVAGFWVIQATSMDEAVEWARHYPFAPDHPEVEIRPVREAP